MLYLAIADADVTITTSFLADSQPVPPGTPRPSTLTARQRFKPTSPTRRITWPLLQNSGADPQFTAAVATIADGLPATGGAVTVAETEYAQGITPTGDSEMEVASEEAHLTLLPAARTIYQFENSAVMASSCRATSLPTVILAVGLALVGVILLVLGQRWLRRRTHRVFNRGLVVATVALVISAVWLSVAFGLARSDMSTAIGQGANPAEELAQASIDVQQIRGDSILNVIARSGSTSLSEDSAGAVQGGRPRCGQPAGRRSTAGNAKVTSALATAMPPRPPGTRSTTRAISSAITYQYANEQASVLSDAGPRLHGGDRAAIDQALAAARAPSTRPAKPAPALTASWRCSLSSRPC